jgi:hypothetical protein
LCAAGKWCHQACFKKLDVPIGTRGLRRYPVVTANPGPSIADEIKEEQAQEDRAEEKKGYEP